MKQAYRIFADILVFIHFLIIIVVLLGWIWPKIWTVYFSLLIVTLASDGLLGYCFLSKWEFDLRKKINPDIDYDFAWATYYTYRVTNYHISDRLYGRLAIGFLIISILVNIYFKFLKF